MDGDLKGRLSTGLATNLIDVLERHRKGEQSGDLDLVMSTIVRSEPKWELYPLGVGVYTIEGVRELYRRLIPLFTNVIVNETIESMWVDDRSIATELIHEMDMGKGEILKLPVVGILRFREGLVCGETVYMTQAESEIFMNNLGQDFFYIPGVVRI